ncbi:hypothetical protein [Rhodovulum adriaticum]|uniref:hypothetical protein n=1 Tax=Rhodovulum adriaticum TaxID=35804 RepID=UPI0014045534|nr:hypothetical protein [Rhodovulum adriaticum]
MWSFLAIFVLVVIGAALLIHPGVGRVLSLMMAWSAFLLFAFLVSIVIWLAIGAPG